MSRPEEAIWLINQLNRPSWLRMVYDYSHYAFRDMPLEDTVRTALPFTAHIAVKDAVQRAGKVEFLPPGASHTFNYARLLRLFYDGGYRGDICCEISSMVSKKPGYDPISTARSCYRDMSLAFSEALSPAPAENPFVQWANRGATHTNSPSPLFSSDIPPRSGP